MRTRLLPLKRLRERAALFAALCAVVAIVTGLGVGLSGYLANAEDAGARVELETQTGSAVALAASLDRVDAAEAQDSAMRAVLDDTFRSDGDPIAVTVVRSVATESMVTFTSAGAEGRALFESIADLPGVATLDAGGWPSSASEVSIQTDAAQALGLAVGDTLTLKGGDLVVKGTWRVNNPLDPRWFDNPIITTGSDELRVGPIVADEQVVAEFAPRVSWTIIPDPDAITAADLSAIVSQWKGLSHAVRAAGDLDSATLDQAGRLVNTAIGFGTRANALHAVQPVALLIIAAIAIVTVIELTRLLGGLRSSELLLLWSRGARGRRLAGASAIEAAAVATLGAVIGTTAVSAVLIGLGAGHALDLLGPTLWVVPLLVVVFVVVAMTLSTVIAVRTLSRTSLSTTVARVGRVGGRGAVALVTVAAAIAVWQLLLYGSPVTPSRSGGTQVDPIAVLAPSLALVDLVLIAAILLPLLGRVIERRAARGTGFARLLSARTLSRRSAIALTPFLLVGLACGQLVVAGAYAQTWDHSFTVARQLRTGSETRVTGGRLALSTEVLDTVATAKGVTGVAPVLEDTVAISSQSGLMVALAPAALAELALPDTSVLDRDAVASDLAIDSPGAALPVGASSIRLDVAVVGLAALPTARALLSSPLGDLRSVDLASTGDSYSANLPALPNIVDGGWQLMGLEVDLPAAREPEVSLTLDRLLADGDDIGFDRGWVAVSLVAQPFVIESPEDGFGFTAGPDEKTVRIAPTYGDRDDIVSIPVVISEDLADSTGVQLGDSVGIDLEPRLDSFICVVRAIVPAVPGAAENAALLIDSRMLQAIRLRTYTVVAAPSQAWVATADSAVTAAALRAVLPAQVAVETLAVDPSRDVLRPASDALWIGAAGTALLALVALGAVVGAQLRSRTGEVLVLRALGVSARMQAVMRRGELAAVLCASVIGGLAAGVAVAFLTVPPLARAAVPGAYDSIATPLRFALVPLATSTALLAVLMALVVVAYGAGVAVQARRATGREGDA